MVKNTNPRPSQSVYPKHRPASSQKQLWILRAQRQRISRSARYFKKETKAAEIHREGKPA